MVDAKKGNILILGSGLVTGPMVTYLLNHGYTITIASQDFERAEKLLAGHSQSKAVNFDVNDQSMLDTLVSENDITVSLLPAMFHVKVAESCIRFGKNMVTSSYVSEEMNALSDDALGAGILILNELGLDPGIDHMSAMKIIDQVRKNGGEVSGFASYCGGLPAPDSNTNPWGYKFSWSPRGVVLAGKNAAHYLEANNIVEIPSKELFTDSGELQVNGIGELEIYPNRDSLPYIKKYSLEGVETMFRGTLRYPGHCQTWLGLVKLGLLDTETTLQLTDKSWQNVLEELPVLQDLKDTSLSLEEKIAQVTGIAIDNPLFDRYRWLGLFDNQPLNLPSMALLDLLSRTMEKKMFYQKNERDMVVLQHNFTVRYPDHGELLTSTFIDYGEVGGESAMARTVSIPAAIGVRLILEGKIKLHGVRIPVDREIYEPILAELEEIGMVFEEKTQRI